MYVWSMPLFFPHAECLDFLSTLVARTVTLSRAAPSKRGDLTERMTTFDDFLDGLGFHTQYI